MVYRLLLASLTLLGGCGVSEPAIDVSRLSEEFVHATLAFSPVSATGAGYHVHENKRLDDLLDDYSPGSLDVQRKFYRDFEARVEKARARGFGGDDGADLEILANQIGLALLELDTLQSYRHNPTVYVELIGNALYTPFVLEYARKTERYANIIRRLERIPALLDQARVNLTDAPEVWNTVAQEENEGNIGLIEKTLREAAPPEMLPRYDQAAAVALPALRSFSEYLKTDLSKRRSDWRLGSQKYEQKFRRVIAVGKTPAQILAEAEAHLKAVREQMHQLAGKLGAPPGGSIDVAVTHALLQISGRHATRDTYFADANRDLAEAREFVISRKLLPLPGRDNLKVIETPAFMRGIYAVGGFNPAPMLEPQLGAFYWITPIPADWPPDRTESKLREYNYYGLKLLTIHEAMPGHYVQFEYANDVQPRSRRMLRGLNANGPYVEGWAVYATELMLDEGYLEKSPELRMTFLKQQLRMLANTILDVRLQTMGMTDQQAMDLMTKQTFQELEEATAKLRRAKLSSCQLPTYFAGWREWNAVRDEYRTLKGKSFVLAEFHERALKAGAVPMPALRKILIGK